MDNPKGNVQKAVKELKFDLRDALAADMKWICTRADSMVMLKGWKKSKGAKAEHALAEALGLKIIYL